MLRVVYSFPNRLGGTGIGNTAWHQVQGVIDQGAEVHVFCGTCDRPLRGAASVVETMRWMGVRVPFGLLGDDRTWALHDRKVARAIGRMSRPDVVHCWPLGAMSTLQRARALGCMTVLERPNTHTAYAYEVVGEELRRLGLELPAGHSHARNPDRLRREEREYQLADFLLCPSDFVMRTFLERGFAPERVLRHRYGYEEGLFTPGDQDRGSGRGLTVCFVGSCEPRKGLHFALDAWLRSGAAANGTFLIAGTFVPGYRELLRDRLAHPSIKELGFTREIAGVMRGCDVMVLPTLEEGSALVTYEARASGCVLLVSESAGAPCVHMHDGLVHRAGDVEVLSRHLTMLANDRLMYEKLRQASLAGAAGLTWGSASPRSRRASSPSWSASQPTGD